MERYIYPFQEINLTHISEVGGKNSSLGEMFMKLGAEGIRIPDGFATTAFAYQEFLESNQLVPRIQEHLKALDTAEFTNLHETGEAIRKLILGARLQPKLEDAIRTSYERLSQQYGQPIQVAVRSSATAEDLPNASFAGQHESYLNIAGEQQVLQACLRCYASLFTDRAIKYRHHHGFDHLKVYLSVGIQKMVRSDLASAGVCFTIDPESGFKEVALITGSWGLGENVVQGAVNPDEFYVFKPTLREGKLAIIRKNMGSKAQTMVYAEPSEDLEASPVLNIDTPPEKQDKFVLTDAEITQLARWTVQIESHYGLHMDIEWAKDGLDGKIYIVQARPETVHSQDKTQVMQVQEFTLTEEGKLLTSGKGIGQRIVSGTARLLNSPQDAHLLHPGEILVTDITNPDWDPILKKVSAIITNKGGRTSHAAIVARELGALAVVGTGDATQVIRDGQELTISCADGQQGLIYEGKLAWSEKTLHFENLRKTRTKVMFILGDPERAFQLAAYPNDGVGLMRLEFIINSSIRIHPMALVKYQELQDENVKAEIDRLTHYHENKESYFVDKLAEAVATIAAAFYPKDVIVRMSDFKTNEYANLIGGKGFEPEEENPMLGFRGASRYYNPRYREGFGLECKAMKKVRDDMGLTNVKLMIPFCRTVEEGRKVIDIMKNFGLKQGENGLEVYVMAEIPSNVLLAKQFAEVFDGFSIGSNDLTQLTLGIDRDSSIVSELFNEQDEAAKAMMSAVIRSARACGRKIGLCGQAPSDFPEFASFLVRQGIDSISFNPDALLQGLQNIVTAEDELDKADKTANTEETAPAFEMPDTQHTYDNTKTPATMKTLLVPIDFSANSRNALDYAAALASETGSPLILAHVIPVEMAGVMESTIIRTPTDSETASCTTQLNELARQKEREHGNKFKVDVVCTSGMFLEKMIQLIRTKHVDLVIMGTEGANTVLEKLIGTNTLGLIQSGVCPVLAVPAQARYEGIQNIAYASDLKTSEKPFINQLFNFAHELKAEVNIVHVKKHKNLSSDYDQDKFAAITQDFPEWDYSLAEVKADNAIEGLNTFVNENKVDVLALALHERGLLEDLFHKSVSRYLALHSSIPLLALPDPENKKPAVGEPENQLMA